MKKILKITATMLGPLMAVSTQSDVYGTDFSFSEDKKLPKLEFDLVSECKNFMSNQIKLRKNFLAYDKLVQKTVGDNIFVTDVLNEIEPSFKKEESQTFINDTINRLAPVIASFVQDRNNAKTNLEKWFKSNLKEYLGDMSPEAIKNASKNVIGLITGFLVCESIGGFIESFFNEFWTKEDWKPNEDLEPQLFEDSFGSMIELLIGTFPRSSYDNKVNLCADKLLQPICNKLNIGCGQQWKEQYAEFKKYLRHDWDCYIKQFGILSPFFLVSQKDQDKKYPVPDSFFRVDTDDHIEFGEVLSPHAGNIWAPMEPVVIMALNANLHHELKSRNENSQSKYIKLGYLPLPGPGKALDLVAGAFLGNAQDSGLKENSINGFINDGTPIITRETQDLAKRLYKANQNVDTVKNKNTTTTTGSIFPNNIKIEGFASNNKFGQNYSEEEDSCNESLNNNLNEDPSKKDIYKNTISPLKKDSSNKIFFSDKNINNIKAKGLFQKENPNEESVTEIKLDLDEENAEILRMLNEEENERENKDQGKNKKKTESTVTTGTGNKDFVQKRVNLFNEYYKKRATEEASKNPAGNTGIGYNDVEYGSIGPQNPKKKMRKKVFIIESNGNQDATKPGEPKVISISGNGVPPPPAPPPTFPTEKPLEERQIMREKLIAQRQKEAEQKKESEEKKEEKTGTRGTKPLTGQTQKSAVDIKELAAAVKNRQNKKNMNQKNEQIELNKGEKPFIDKSRTGTNPQKKNSGKHNEKKKNYEDHGSVKTINDAIDAVFSNKSGNVLFGNLIKDKKVNPFSNIDETSHIYNKTSQKIQAILHFCGLLDPSPEYETIGKGTLTSKYNIKGIKNNLILNFGLGSMPKNSMCKTQLHYMLKYVDSLGMIRILEKDNKNGQFLTDKFTSNQDTRLSFVTKKITFEKALTMNLVPVFCYQYKSVQDPTNFENKFIGFEVVNSEETNITENIDFLDPKYQEKITTEQSEQQKENARTLLYAVMNSLRVKHFSKSFLGVK